jgi:FKBP-type peptidyl-prolyl cis-trans isomerase (trigger factor)
MKTNTPKIEKLANKSFIIKLIISKDDIQKSHQQSLQELQAEFETKGFRKGKAPLDVIEREVPFEKRFEKTASRVISQEYGKVIKDNDLKPIIQPRVKFEKAPEDFNNDWHIEITSSELPEVKLNKDYLEKIKKVKTNSKAKKEQQKTEEIVISLISSAKVELPEILIESDLQHQLSQLVNQAQQAGITVEQHLASQKTNIKDYQENLKKRIIREWTLNLSIQKIAKDNKIEVSPQEVQDMLKKNPALGQNMNLVNYILIQQKVIDFLKK